MYGATEVGDVAYECKAKTGWHVCEETIVEIVDPATGKNVEPGTLGEVVVTRLNDIFFLLRFGTGDLSRLVTKKCSCGRTSYRLAGIAGRIGDAVKVRGLFIAPSQLKLLSARFDNILLQAVVGRKGHEDVLTLRVDNSNTLVNTDKWKNNFKKIFKELCTVRIDVLEVVEKGGIKPDQKMIVDCRTW